MKKITIVNSVAILILIILIMNPDNPILPVRSQLQYPLDTESIMALDKGLDSILADKMFDLMWRKMVHVMLWFESLDGYTTSGTVATDGLVATLTTGNVSGNSAEINKQPTDQGLFVFNQSSRFRTAFNVRSVSAQTIYITYGNKDSADYYGFKIVDNTLYGVTKDGTTENAVSLQTIITTPVYNIEARFEPDKGVLFIVDTVQKGKGEKNLPRTNLTGANAQLMDIEITTNENVAKIMDVSFFEYLQKRNALNY